MNKIEKLERNQKLQWSVILILLVAIVVLTYKLYQSAGPGANDVLRTRGIIIDDMEGNPRIMLGFPIQSYEKRVRNDSLNGIVLLDKHGVDRVHLGTNGQLFLGNNFYDRDNEGWSLFFNDALGEERTGYGFSDSDNSVGLGMDYGGEHGGEAIYLYAAPRIAFMTVNADLGDGDGVRDRIVLWHDTSEDLSLIKLSDSKKDGRMILKAEKGEEAVLKYK